jgi:hypothetical protein
MDRSYKVRLQAIGGRDRELERARWKQYIRMPRLFFLRGKTTLVLLRRDLLHRLNTKF